MAIRIKLTKNGEGYAYACTLRNVVLAEGFCTGTKDEAHHEAKNHLEQLGVINDGEES